MDRGGAVSVSAPGDLGPRQNVRLGRRMMIWDGEARSELRCFAAVEVDGVGVDAIIA